MLERLWIYQRERFPLPKLAALALVVGCSSTAFSSLLRARPGPSMAAVFAAAVAALLIWMQMRVLDEFKDAEDDARHRPYLPAPRGLVTSGELRAVLIAAGLGEIALALSIDARLLWLLAALWAYLALMTAEFFVRSWLRERPFAYIATHCPIGCLVALYASAFDWLPAGAAPPPALLWLGLASLICTVLLEIGRKIRAPRDEEPGVITYSAAWGRALATNAWLAALVLAVLAGWLAARQIGFGTTFAALMAPVGLAAVVFAWRYLDRPETRRARMIEGLSAAATMVLYLGLGPLPAILLH
jgi:4-hydroxybenzoate polyprenyltransferase